ncbi:ATP-binding cassette domain-containing protein [Enterococcus massiliensis]|uniref:ATP-binding cassette domain-containing protein n=1 Tax=Enterococcus massiliensis TaxID=1640685 RepID=UPI00065DCFA9|nr:ATP-binding cassette domain-containing protein [Enterococcus massiliensis]
MEFAIEGKNLSKKFGEHLAVDAINFQVAAGKIFALLGENGAGKTTTIHLLTGLLKPTAGEIFYEGIKASRKEIRSQIGVTGQFAALDEELTGRENLEILGQLHSLPKKIARKKAIELLKQFQLEQAADRKVSQYSGGMKRRLDIAASLLGDPKVLFLDEPTTGIDPANRRKIWKLIADLAKKSGMTIFLTTQYLEEAEILADYVTIMSQGKIIADGSIQTLKKQLPESKIHLQFSNEKDFQKAQLVLIGEKIALLPENKLEILAVEKVQKLTSLFSKLADHEIVVSDVQLLEPTLEDVYLEVTKGGSSHAMVS